jgi:phosphohistidine phosphatase
MKLLLARHAIAEDRETFQQSGEPDEKRPLTKDGRKKMKRTAAGIAELVPQLDVIASSPLTRAVQTAEVLARSYDGQAVTVVDALDPMRPYDAFLAWLKQLDDVETVAAVGHEPHLSGLAAWLLTGNDQTFFEFKKGGACLLELDEIDAGAARMLWLLTPAQLRSLED